MPDIGAGPFATQATNDTLLAAKPPNQFWHVSPLAGAKGPPSIVGIDPPTGSLKGSLRRPAAALDPASKVGERAVDLEGS
jgi:hypothetical protein